MKLTNDQIVEILEDYIKEPRYTQAILIDGAWGSGKTYFLKNHFKEHLQGTSDENVNRKFLYISLNGMADISAITETIFQSYSEDFLRDIAKALPENIKKLYDKISNKTPFELDGSTFSRKIMTNVALKWLKEKGIDPRDFDLDGCFIPKNLIIIFDDLERCQIDIHEILGYINNLVEHNGVKAIIVANEEALEKTHSANGLDANKENKSLTNFLYKDVKEKLIGITLRYEPTLDESYSNILNSIRTDNNNLQTVAQLFLTNHQEIVLDEFKKLQNNNLRTLSHVFMSFEKLYLSLELVEFPRIETPSPISSGLKSQIKEIEYTKILKYLTSRAILSKKGGKYCDWNKKESTCTCIPTIGEDGKEDNWSGWHCAYKFIDDYIQFGVLDQAEINSVLALNYLDHFNSKSEELKGLSIFQLENWRVREEEEISKLLTKLEEELENDEYLLFTYTKIANLYVSLRKYQLCEEQLATLEPIINKSFYRRLENTENTHKLHDFLLFERNTTGEANSEFHEFVSSWKVEKKKVSTYPTKELNQLLSLVHFDSEQFYSLCSERKIVFHQNDIFFADLNVDKLIAHIEKCDIQGIYDISLSLEKIYCLDKMGDFFPDDSLALEQFQNKVQQIHKKAKGKTRILALEKLLASVEKSLNVLSMNQGFS